MSSDRIEKQILLHAPVSKVWRALTDSKQFGAWFGVRFEAPFTAGVRISGVVVPTTVDPDIAKAQEKYTGKPFEITVAQIEPERLFSFRWHPFAMDTNVDYSSEPTTLIEFVLTEVDGGTLLTVTESGFDGIPAARREQAFKANEGGWSAVVKLIEKFVTQHG